MADFLYNVPRSFLIHIVRKADAGRGYDDTEVRASVLLDVDRGSVKSQRDYARIWGRSRGWIRNRWDDIQRDVVGYCTSNGRQLDGPLAQKLPPEWLDPPSPLQAQPEPNLSPENGDSEQETTNPSPLQAQPEPSPSPHTIHPTSPSPSEAPSPARARGDDFDPVGQFNETYAAIPEQHPWTGFRLGIMQEPRVRGTVTNADAWAETLRVWTEREYSPRNLDNILDRYRADAAALAAPEPDAGDEGRAGGEVPAPRRTRQPNGATPGSTGRGTAGLRGTPQHRKSASDRRSEYGYDDASRDVDAALADLIAADEARRGAADAGGRDDG